MSDFTDGLNRALSDRYRIEREIGEGGMATVYLADDLRHERNVALKVLKPELAAVVGAERFLSEIRTTANLQHPHILPLFDSGEAEGFLYFVMPYIEGETLRDRLERERQLPVDEAVEIAGEVADALDYAHRQGVVHRDIKPANILLHEGRPQLTDFGIALAVSEAGGGRLTETGLSLGTPHYMSPEQASGERSVDARTDVYALACVLYEMLAGQPPFPGGSAQAVLARILTTDPEPITATRRTVPPHVEAAVARAMEKLPADRFGSARAFREALDDASFRHTVRALGAPSARPADAGTPGGIGSRRPSRIAAGALAVFLVLAAGWALGSRGTTTPADAPVLRVPVDMSGLELNPWEGIVLSPDGSAMAVAASRGDGPISIRARRADEATFRALPGTEGGCCPSFSPDGEWIAFQADDRALRKVSLGGGQPTTLVSASVEPSALTHWGDDGMIVFSGAEGLYEVSENGGEPTLLVEDSELFRSHLHRFPGDRGVLGSSDARRGVWLYEPGADSLRTLVEEGEQPTYLASGHLAYRHPEGGLWAAPFDVEALALTGPARPVLDEVEGWRYSVSEGGTLVYTAGDPGVEPVRFVLVPLDGASPDTLPLAPGNMSQAAVSPDGGRIAFTVRDGVRPDIFVYDMDLGGPTQLTFGRFGSRDPVWSPDGTRIAFHTSDSGDAFSDTDVWVKPLDGSTPAAPVITGDGGDLLRDWTPDDLLLYWRPVAGGGIRIRPLHDESGDEAFLDVEWRQWQPSLSPDGAWLVYVADPPGQGGVYVRRFPDGTGQQRVSDGEAYDPRWSPSGDVIYYRGEGETIVAARVRLEPTFAVLEREVVYEGPFRGYDVHPTEPRLLLMTPAPEVPGSESDADPQRWFIVTNWFTELRERLGEAN